MKAKTTWIVVADEKAVRVFQTIGFGKGFDERKGSYPAAEPVPDRELVSDKPGRAFDSRGFGRHAMEFRTSPKRTEEKKFARKIAEWLIDEDRRHHFDRLAIIAPPKLLGDLRREIPGGLNSKVFREVAKDFVNESSAKIAKHFDQLGLV
ncbi:MAG: host attachment protein [Alphaproteobacteria bacterium]|nr:host attachment protein [Alphaproteobacteria bacterium]